VFFFEGLRFLDKLSFGNFFAKLDTSFLFILLQFVFFGQSWFLDDEL